MMAGAKLLKSIVLYFNPKSKTNKTNIQMKQPNNREIMIQLDTDRNFYKYWFSQLGLEKNRHKSKVEIFNEVNELYSDFTKSGNGRFPNYRNFQKVIQELIQLDNPDK